MHEQSWIVALFQRFRCSCKFHKQRCVSV